jgi:hypothetical protein
VFSQDTNSKKYKVFREFKKELWNKMDTINESGQWEMPPLKSKIDSHMLVRMRIRQTKTDDIMERLQDIFSYNKHYPTHTQRLKKVIVHPYKKDGVQIHLQYENKKLNGQPIRETDELYYEIEYRSQKQKMDKVKPIETYDWFLLKECKEGFHRDWDRDGICVGDET